MADGKQDGVPVSKAVPTPVRSLIPESSKSVDDPQKTAPIQKSDEQPEEVPLKVDKPEKSDLEQNTKKQPEEEEEQGQLVAATGEASRKA